jgi:hypothetical protein
VATALVMTIGFAMILYVPSGYSIKDGEVSSASDWVAICAYVLLVLFGTVNSTLGVWWAGHGVAQVDWHPAANFGFFWHASLNTTLGQCQQFAKVGVVQLVLALLPLCYMQFGYFGLGASTAALAYAYMQLLTWQKMGGLMREGYKAGLSHGAPVVLDVSDVPPALQTPFSAHWAHMATGQFGSSLGYAMRGYFGAKAGDGSAKWMDASSGECINAVPAHEVAVSKLDDQATMSKNGRGQSAKAAYEESGSALPQHAPHRRPISTIVTREMI